MSTVATIFNTLGDIIGEIFLNKNGPFRDDFHIACIRLQKYFIANLFAKVSIWAPDNATRGMSVPTVRVLALPSTVSR